LVVSPKNNDSSLKITTRKNSLNLSKTLQNVVKTFASEKSIDGKTPFFIYFLLIRYHKIFLIDCTDIFDALEFVYLFLIAKDIK